MRKLGVLVFVAACGSSSSSDPVDVPDDHKLHDLSSDGPEATRVRYGGKAISLADLPMVAGKLGLPVTGTADVSIDLTTPKSAGKLDVTKTTGSISLSCTKCQIGDDVAKLQLGGKRANAFASEGVHFGRLTVDSFEAKLTAANGKLELTSWKLASPDVEVEVALSIEFRPALQQSQVSGCIRFKSTEALQKRDPKMHALLSLTGAARGADGFEHIKLAGTISDVKRLAQDCGEGS